MVVDVVHRNAAAVNVDRRPSASSRQLLRRCPVAQHLVLLGHARDTLVVSGPRNVGVAFVLGGVRHLVALSIPLPNGFEKSEWHKKREEKGLLA
jgi:hypothetical protein